MSVTANCSLVTACKIPGTACPTSSLERYEMTVQACPKIMNDRMYFWQLLPLRSKVRSPNFGHVWKLCCDTSTLSSVFSMRLVLTIPSVSFFEHSKFEVISIWYTDDPSVSTLVFEINKMERRTLISDTWDFLVSRGPTDFSTWKPNYCIPDVPTIRLPTAVVTRRFPRCEILRTPRD